MLIVEAAPRTLADLLAIPEHERFHELIDGELVPKAKPSFRHGTAQAGLSGKLGLYNRRSSADRPGGWRIATETEVRFGDSEVYRPDTTGSSTPSRRRSSFTDGPRGATCSCNRFKGQRSSLQSPSRTSACPFETSSKARTASASVRSKTARRTSRPAAHSAHDCRLCRGLLERRAGADREELGGGRVVAKEFLHVAGVDGKMLCYLEERQERHAELGRADAVAAVGVA